MHLARRSAWPTPPTFRPNVKERRPQAADSVPLVAVYALMPCAAPIESGVSARHMATRTENFGVSLPACPAFLWWYESHRSCGLRDLVLPHQ